MRRRNRNEPPTLANWLLSKLLKDSFHEELLGDLQEIYQERVSSRGRWFAGFMGWLDVLHLIIGFGSFRPFRGQANLFFMYKHYFVITTRNLLRNKVYAGINILGLALGLTCCLLIFQYILFEYSFDTFNRNFDTIYRVVETTFSDGKEPYPSGRTGWAIGPALENEVPEVKHFVRMHPEYNNAVVSNPAQPEKVFEEKDVFYTDASFFKVFSYPFILGDSTRPLSEPETVVISESLAKKYFGEENPIGKTLSVRGWIVGTYRIEGVVEDPPKHSHLQFDILLPMSDLLKKSRFNNPSTAWGWTNFLTYVQLQKGSDLNKVNQKFSEILERNQKDKWEQSNITKKVHAQALNDIHLNEEIESPRSLISSYRSVYFLSIIGIITLFIALINYVNITTASAFDRAREVGIRKVVGALRRQLMSQFFFESTFTILIAFSLSLAASEYVKPHFNELIGTTLPSLLSINSHFWLMCGGLFLLINLLAGFYPAIVLSIYKPINVLKGSRNPSTHRSWLRQGLVVFQFAASIVLLIGTSVVYIQLNFMQNMDMGMDISQILTVSAPRVLPEETTREKAVESFRQELLKLPFVEKVATSDAIPGGGYSFTSSSVKRIPEGQSENVPCAALWIDSTFAQLYGIELLTGDGFKQVSLKAADEEPYPVIANETAIYALGFDSPDQAIHEQVDISNGNICRIVGVYKDVNWASTRFHRQNSFYFMGAGLPHISIKIGTENLANTVSKIGEVYKALFPDNPYLCVFADDSFDLQYKNDQRFAKLFSVFAVLAILISCLGLFGLATFTAQQRTKEIGIRKVLGATVADIVTLLSKDFLTLVIIGFFLAIPIAWYAMGQWLEGFANRIEIGVEVYLLAGLVAILIALGTVSWQSIKAAMSNPVDSLRNE